ncbi:hypothetical protein J6590_096517 [Homalodisca vitripennis]|nr:hypothetical protein J6590_096517 [Homalodisca vitripennis]
MEEFSFLSISSYEFIFAIILRPHQVSRERCSVFYVNLQHNRALVSRAETTGGYLQLSMQSRKCPDFMFYSYLRAYPVLPDAGIEALISCSQNVAVLSL